MMVMVIGFLFPFLIGSGDIITAIQLACIYLIGSSGLGIIFWLVRLAIEGDRSRMLPFLPALIIMYWILLFHADTILSLVQI
jgi:prepilin signal peptidase PulO-like enzyme (type II secretory pathway)